MMVFTSWQDVNILAVVRAWKHIRFLTAALLLVLSVQACNDDNSGSVTASAVSLKGCNVDSPFEISIGFVAWDACEDILMLRCQEKKDSVSVSDGIEFSIPDLQQLRAALDIGQAARRVEDGGLTVTLYLNESCPGSYYTLAASTGEFTFEKIEPETGGNLKFSGEFDLVNSHTGEKAAADVQFSLDWTLSAGDRFWPFCP